MIKDTNTTTHYTGRQDLTPGKSPRYALTEGLCVCVWGGGVNKTRKRGVWGLGVFGSKDRGGG